MWMWTAAGRDIHHVLQMLRKSTRHSWQWDFPLPFHSLPRGSFTYCTATPNDRTAHPPPLSLGPTPSSPAHALFPTQPAGSVQFISKQLFSGFRKGWARGCSCQCCELWPSACLHPALFILVFIVSWGLSQDAGRKCWVLDEQKSTLSTSFWRKWREKTYKRKIKMKYAIKSPAHHLRWVHRFRTNEDLLKPTSRNP